MACLARCGIPDQLQHVIQRANNRGVNFVVEPDSRATRAPKSEVSATSARHSRVRHTSTVFDLSKFSAKCQSGHPPVGRAPMPR
jgi:hypothetical protein